jgi:1,4-alpha-glucan branching enzyme
MSKIGGFTFVLHSHLPYARQAGMWPHGEEWVHEAIAETYLPLLNALYDLKEEGVRYKLTIGVTPILGEQLADPTIIDHFISYAAERSAWAEEDLERFEASGEQGFRDLAKFYHHFYARALTSFQDRFKSDLLGALAMLQQEGYVEIATSAATHGYLPLLSRDSSISGQLATGVKAYEKRFGTSPKSIWLPECAYRPAYYESTPDGEIRRPGLESFLAKYGLQEFFSETHSVEGGNPVGKAADQAIGPYGAVTRKYSPELEAHEVDEPRTTFQPYWVGDEPGKVAVLARNNDTGQQVWSATYGYPGDYWYREFHKKDATSGLQYWRVGGSGLDLALKPLYEPQRAVERVEEHAEHYAQLVRRLLTEYYDANGEYGIISAAYDTELFGHWWFEGVDWLKSVLRRLSEAPEVELTTAYEIVSNHPPDRVLALPESSWGAGGGHFTWLNADTQWMWPKIHAAERRMEQLVATSTGAIGSEREFLNQAARELLLLQSSDWPFLVTTGQARDYAVERFEDHLTRFDQLAELLELGKTEEPESVAFLRDLQDRDNPFPNIDYRDFRAHQGSVA